MPRFDGSQDILNTIPFDRHAGPQDLTLYTLTPDQKQLVRFFPDISLNQVRARINDAEASFARTPGETGQALSEKSEQLQTQVLPVESDPFRACHMSLLKRVEQFQERCNEKEMKSVLAWIPGGAIPESASVNGVELQFSTILLVDRPSQAFRAWKRGGGVVGSIEPVFQASGPGFEIAGWVVAIEGDTLNNC